jgi:tetratricopeptide (TPR) repeat protein
MDSTGVNYADAMKPNVRIFPCLVGLLTYVLTAPILGMQDSKKPVSRPPSDWPSEASVIEDSVDQWNFENDGTAAYVERTRVRIQSEAGREEYGVLAFPYKKASERLEIDFVRVRKQDGSTVATTLEDVQDMPAEVTQVAPFYSDLREKHVAVKNLSVGDVLEFQSHGSITKPLAPGQFWFDLVFPRNRVVLEQKVEISVPRDRPVKVKGTVAAPRISEAGKRRIYTWTWSNREPQRVPGYEMANMTVHGTFPAPDIQLSSFQSWEEVGRWYEGLQLERVEPTPEVREKAAELTRNTGDDAAKIQAIYKYVSTEFRYIGVDFGIGRYQSHFASEVLTNQYGDCKDKHTLLASLLSAAGIPAYPALISSARTVDPNVPSPSQFDHVITVVPRGKEFLWLDTTTEVGPLGYLLVPLRGKSALVVFHSKPADFQTTPAGMPFPGGRTFKIDGALDSAGTLTGKVEQIWRGDAEVLLRSAFRRTPRAKWKDLVQGISIGSGFGGEVSDVSASTPESTETPFRVTYTYTRKDYSEWKESRISLPAPAVVVSPAEEEGKLPQSLYLGELGETQIECKVKLPAGYTVSAPPNLDLNREFADYHSDYSFTDNVVVAHYRLTLNKRDIAGDAVKDYQAFAERVHKDKDQFVPVVSGGRAAADFTSMQQQIWNLPDSTNPEAMQLEQEARGYLANRSPLAALNALKRAVEKDPKFTRDWIFLGQMYLYTGQPLDQLHFASAQKEDGIKALRKAVETDPQQPLTYKVLAFALASQQRYAEAIQAWQDLAKISPENRDIPANMGSLLMAEKRYQEAVPYLESAVKLFPDKPAPVRLLGNAYLESGQEEKAATAFEKAVQLDPGSETKNGIAYALAVANKRLDDALRYAQDAVRVQESDSRKVDLQHLEVGYVEPTPALGAYWDTLGWVHYRLGNYKQAEGYLYAAWLLRQDPVLGYHLGQVYEAENRKLDAVHMYRLVFSQRPRDPENQDAVTEAQKRLSSLHVSATLPRAHPSYMAMENELSMDRTVRLPRIVAKEARAEFFIEFAPGPKVVDTRFLSGSPELKSAGKVLSQARFKVAFPENSTGRLVRRGFLGCYPMTGCSFVLFPVDMTRAPLTVGTTRETN